MGKRSFDQDNQTSGGSLAYIMALLTSVQAAHYIAFPKTGKNLSGLFFSEVMAALSPSDRIDLAIKRLLHKSLLTSRNNDRTSTFAHPPPREQPMKARTPTQRCGCRNRPLDLHLQVQPLALGLCLCQRQVGGSQN